MIRFSTMWHLLMPMHARERERHAVEQERVRADQEDIERRLRLLETEASVVRLDEREKGS